MWATIISITYVLGIVSAVDAIMSARTPQGSIAWAVSLVTFPWIAVPSYWVLGRSKFHGMAGAYRGHLDELLPVIGRVKSRIEAGADLGAGHDPHKRVLQQISGSRFMRDNAVELLIDGDATFASIVDGIERAERHVLVHFYMFKPGTLGDRLVEAMKAKARAGLTTVLLYDEIGSLGFPDRLRRSLEADGVLVSEYGTTQGWRNRFQLNFRNHRKIVVVDGRVAWIGGHNVGDEYLGLDPDIGAWRDTHLKITGPGALSAQSVVVGDWFWATRTLLDLDWDVKRAATDADASVLVLPSGPADALETASMTACELCDMATERLWIESPYFVPDDAVLASLRIAALRGVDVRIVVPDKSDNRLVDLAALWYIDQLKETNIRFFRYQEGFLHSKTAIVDDTIGVVGTVNWDSRSFRLNFEVNAIVDDEPLVDEMSVMFLKDFARSTEMDKRELEQRGFFFNLAVRVCRLLSPVL